MPRQLPVDRLLLPAIFLAGIIVVALSATFSLSRRPPPPQEALIEGKFELIATSTSTSKEEQPPAGDCLVVNEYRVTEALTDGIDAGRVQVAHWSMLDGIPVPFPQEAGESYHLELAPFDSVDGLDKIPLANDINPFAPRPLFLDHSQTLSQEKLPDVVRYDYRGKISGRMKLFWQLRPQLKLVVIGGPESGVGVSPQSFYPAENNRTPVVLNLSGSGSFDEQKVVADQYASRLPNLRWLVWCLTPRAFNQKLGDTSSYFESSTGHLFDRRHGDELWPVAPVFKGMETADAIESPSDHFDIWGAARLFGSRFDFALDDTRAEHIREQCESVSFVLKRTVFEQLESSLHLLASNGTRVFLFVPPLHPDTARARAIDSYGTGRDDYRAIVTKLKGLANKMPHVSFTDFHRAGNHGFSADHFYDIDHLNTEGAQALSRRIASELGIGRSGEKNPPRSGGDI